MENNTKSLKRRKFIQQLSFGSLILLSGKVLALDKKQADTLKSKVILRFAVASDVHYGQPGTAYQAMLDVIIKQINSEHQQSAFDFCVINGDIIHNEPAFLLPAKEHLSTLSMPFHVTRGNHDLVTLEKWRSVFGVDFNYQIDYSNTAVLLADSSNEKGEYLSPDLNWLKQQLDASRDKKHVLLFVHIPQAKRTKNGIETPAFFELLAQYPNIKSVFHGHEHDQDGVQMLGKIPFLFDSHVGGNWGTAYKGFRICELLNDGSMLTYMMNPINKLNELSF